MGKKLNKATMVLASLVNPDAKNQERMDIESEISEVLRLIVEETIEEIRDKYNLIDDDYLEQLGK
jgi:hypothetical protein